MSAYRLFAAVSVLSISMLATGCATFGLGGAGCGAGIGGCADSCGACGDTCGGGCNMAFQKWTDCGNCQGPKLCPCTGPECSDGSCGIGPGCGCAEPACGCDVGCGMESGCTIGCGDGACGGGCGDVCGCDKPTCGVLYSVKYALGSVAGCVLSPFFACGGCDGELYWSEWHNDPPRCCDPCDKCGNWIGPAAGYRAPYDHPYGVARETGSSTVVR